jgi:elongation factor P
MKIRFKFTIDKIMKIGGNEVRPGNVILYENRLWLVVKTQHTQPGKGGAYMQVELKDMKEGTKKNERFRAAEPVERIFIDEKEFQYLYSEQESFVLMNQETYDQIAVSEDVFSASVHFLQEGMILTVGFYENSVIYVNLPSQVVLEVVEADGVVKGQTASSSFKPAKLSNGMKTSVPPHIEIGTKILINTQDCSYVERFKEG